MNLPALFIQVGAIVAQSISTSTRSAFRLGYVAAWSTCAVVMMNALVGWFFDFVDGIKRTRSRHGVSFRLGIA
jgi:hypothetical protein